MALNWDKSDIEVKNGDAIKHNQIFCDFMQWTFNCLDELYLREILLFDRCNNEISIEEAECSENWNPEQRKKCQKKRKEGTYKPSPKKDFLQIKLPEQFDKQVTPPIQFLMLTYHNGVNQAVAKKKILACVSLGEILMLRLHMRKWKEKLVKCKRLKYLSVAEKVILIS